MKVGSGEWTGKKISNHWLDEIRFRISRTLSHFLLYHRFRYSLYFRNKLCRWLVPTPDKPTVCSHFGNIELLVDPVKGRGLEEHIYYFGIYEAGTISVLRRFLNEGDIFFDVGANIGSISCVASHFVGENGYVYAFEPHPETYKILEHNIFINKQKNVSALNVALGAEISTAWIYDKPNIGRGAASLIRPENASEKSRRQVYVTTIDTLIETKQLPVPAVIKIDVEGFELQVLRGAEKLLRSAQAPMLCVEYSTLLSQCGGDTREIYTFIKSVNNYSCYKLTRGKEMPSELVRISGEKQLPRHDNIFCFLEDE